MWLHFELERAVKITFATVVFSEREVFVMWSEWKIFLTETPPPVFDYEGSYF